MGEYIRASECGQVAEIERTFSKEYAIAVKLAGELKIYFVAAPLTKIGQRVKPGDILGVCRQ